MVIFVTMKLLKMIPFFTLFLVSFNDIKKNKKKNKKLIKINIMEKKLMEYNII